MQIKSGFNSNNGWEFAYRNSVKFMNVQALYRSDYVIYLTPYGDVMPKYSTYTDDIRLFTLVLNRNFKLLGKDVLMFSNI